MKKSEVLPAAAPADERAALPQIPDLVKATAWLTMCLRTELSRLDDDTHKALDEVEAQLSCVRAITNGAIDYEAMVAARAAASPAAEAVTANWPWSPKQPSTKTLRNMAYALHMYPEGEIVPIQVLNLLRKQFNAAMVAVRANNTECESCGGVGYHGPERDPCRCASEAAPQPAQADAPAHAAECPHCDGEGVIEGDSGTSPCACQRDAQEGMPTFGPRKVQADEPARAMTMEDGYLIQWLRFIGQAPFECDPSIIARRLLSAKVTEEEERLVAELIDKWARAYVKRFPK